MRTSFLLFLSISILLLSSSAITAKNTILNLLIRQWENDHTYLHLKIDGSFKAKLTTDYHIEGFWQLSQDQTLLTLTEAQPIEGKGKKNNGTYVIKNITASAIKLIQPSGEELNLKSAASPSLNYLIQKWTLQNNYLYLNADGSFEAVLDNQAIGGKWGLSSQTENKKILQLIGNNQNTNFVKTYELINLSYNKLVVQDKQGNKLLFTPEKQKSYIY